MTQVIDAGPEIGLVEFPDGMTDEEMGRELTKESYRIEQGKAERTGQMADRAASVAEGLYQVDKGVLEAPLTIARNVGQALATAGKGVVAVGQDVAENLGDSVPSFSARNTKAFLQGEALPADVEDERKLKQEGGVGPAIRLGMRDAGRSVPAVAGAMALQAAGVPLPLAMAGLLGSQTYAETGSPLQAAASGMMGALIPGVGQVGREATGKVLANLVGRGWLKPASAVTQKVVESVASQATVQGLIELTRLPEYQQMNPEERKSALIRSVAGNLTFAAMELPQFKGGVPSETQQALVKDAGYMVSRLLEKGPILSASPDEIAQLLADPRSAEVFKGVAPKQEGDSTTESTKNTEGEGDGTTSGGIVSSSFIPADGTKSAESETKPAEDEARAALLRRKGVWEASTPVEGRRVKGIWTVVDAGDLVSSADAGFDAALQPRDRTREASANQIAEIVRLFEPERLGDSPTTDLGAPIIDEQNQVLSGNGRVTALRQVYGAENSSKAEAYRNFIGRQAEAMGTPKDLIDAIGSMKAPVLVRMASDFGGLSREEFARQSNQQQVLGMGEAEKAGNDAKVVGQILDLWRPSEEGDVLAASNREFLNAFVKGTGDQAELLAGGGYNKGAITRRVKNAVLGNLLEGKGSKELLGALIEQGDELGLRNVVTGVMQAAPQLVKLRTTKPEYDLAPVLRKALIDLVNLKREGVRVADYVKQLDLLTDPERSAESDLMVQALEGAGSAKGVTELLGRYANAAGKQDLQTGDIFGEKARSSSEILKAAIAEGKKGKGAKQQELIAANEKGTGVVAEAPPNTSETSRPKGKGSTEGESLANIEQATLPRAIEGETPGAAAGEPVSLAEIRHFLSKALDIPVRYRGYGKRALGMFRVRPETIRMKAMNDIPTLAHEVGHYLHFLLFPERGPVAGRFLGLTEDAHDFNKFFDGELMPLGQRTSRPSYTEDQVRKEGVAEFVREWMTDRTQALAKAPRFTDFFERELQGKFPEVWKIVEQARADLRRYIQQPVEVKLDSRINRDGSRKRRSAREWWDEQVDDWINELAPIERSLQELVKFGLPANEARMVNDYAVNYIGGWRGKVEYALHQRQIDLEGNDVGPSLREILGGIEDTREFGNYLIGKRELEVGSRGIKTGLDPQDRAEQAKWVAQMDVKYGAKAQQLYQFQRNQLKLLVDSGLISQEAFLKMVAANEFYVPFFRVMEYLTGTGTRKGEGLINLSPGVMKLKGSDRQYIDPLESVLKNAYLFRDLAERNKVATAFVDAVDMVRGGGRVAEPVTKKVRPVKIKGEEIEGKVRQALEAAGIELPADPLLEGMFFTVWRASKQADPKTGRFTVWKEGREQVYQVDDVNLYRALALADSNDASIFSRVPFMKQMRALTRIKRAGATLTLEFIGRNPLRDQLTAAINSKYGFVPFWDGFRGIISAVGKDQWYWDWVKAGGRYADFVATDRRDLQATLKDVIQEPTALRTALELANPLNVLRNLQKFSEIMEQGTRIAEFRNAKKAGLSDAAAANESKDVTLNFSRAGFKGKLVNQLVAFFNAGMQDLDKVARAHRERPLQTAMKAFMYLSMPSIVAWWLGRDDKVMQDLPEWRKSFFWNVNAGKLSGKGDLVLSFPKPFLLGQLYGTSIEKGLDWAYGKDPNAVQKWFMGTLQATPLTINNVLPTIATPLVENWANRSFFRDKPLENAGMQSLPPEFRYDAQTSMIARKLGGLVPIEGGYSPIKIDNLVRGYFAGLGKYGLDASDWLYAKINGQNLPPEPAKSIWERPLIRGFVRSPYEASAYVERFYDGLEKAEQRQNAFKMLANTEGDKAKEFLEENKNSILWYAADLHGKPMLSHLREVRGNMGEVLKAMREVQGSKTLSAEEKRERLLQLGKMRDSLAELGYKLYLSPEDKKSVY